MERGNDAGDADSMIIPNTGMIAFRVYLRKILHEILKIIDNDNTYQGAQQCLITVIIKKFMDYTSL